MVYYQLLEKKTLGYQSETAHPLKEACIYADDFLYDKNDPLRYGLFNAFDGDPSTSFVEDSEDNLLYIEISDSYDKGFPNGFSEFKIINGYAQNEDLYKKNNRPKLIKTGYRPQRYEEDDLCIETDDICRISDGTLGWQKYKFHIDQYFLVKDIYKGTRYSDTCIAELDFKYDGYTFSQYRQDRENDYIEAWRKSIQDDIEPIGWLFSSEPDDE